jgi:hypothetical protein
LSSELNREDAVARFLALVLLYGPSRGIPLFCLYGKVSYPGFRVRHAKAVYAIWQESEKHAGEYPENRAGEDRDSLPLESLKGLFVPNDRGRRDGLQIPAFGDKLLLWRHLQTS